MENFESVSYDKSNARQRFLSRTYGWMFLALGLTAVTAWFTSNSYELMNYIFGKNAIGFYALLAAEFILVLVLSSTLRKLPVWGAVLCLIAYSAINGMTLSSIFFLFSVDTISNAFLCTAATFGAMALFGTFTRKNLSGLGHFALMALIGVLIVSLVSTVSSRMTGINYSRLDWIVSIATVIIFSALTAYDSQRITLAAQNATDSDDYKKVAIYAALHLYINFINIFLSLLRIFGRRN